MALRDLLQETAQDIKTLPEFLQKLTEAFEAEKENIPPELLERLERELDEYISLLQSLKQRLG